MDAATEFRLSLLDEGRRDALQSIFVNKKLKRFQVEQFATELENALFSYKGCTRAFSYAFEDGDVVVVSGLRTGGNQLLNIVNQLMHPEVEEQNMDIPWPEHKSMDAYPRSYRPAKRLFKTMMSYSTLRQTVSTRQNVKFIVAIRDPADYCASMFNFMKQTFESSRGIHKDFHTQFDSVFSPDDFVDVPPTLVHMQGQGTLSYESNMAAWWDAREFNNVLLVPYEHLLNSPEHLIRNLADFLEIQLNTSQLMNNATKTLRESARYPLFHSFQGCEPTVGFSRHMLSFEARLKLREIWDETMVKAYGKEVVTYRELYTALTNEAYPVADYDTEDGITSAFQKLKQPKSCCYYLFG